MKSLLALVVLALSLALMSMDITPTQQGRQTQGAPLECEYINERVEAAGEPEVRDLLANAIDSACEGPRWIISASYFAIHSAVRQEILTWIARKLPYDDDTYVPGGFFVAPPELPGACRPGSSPVLPISKLVLVASSAIRGTVVAVEPMYDSLKDDWNHQTYYLRPDNRGFLNAYSDRVHLSWPGTDGTIKCEPPVSDTRLPHVGDRVVVFGAFCIDLAHGWTTVVPLTWVFAPHRNRSLTKFAQTIARTLPERAGASGHDRR